MEQKSKIKSILVETINSQVPGGIISDLYSIENGDNIISEKWLDELGLYTITLINNERVQIIRYPINKINKTILSETSVISNDCRSIEVEQSKCPNKNNKQNNNIPLNRIQRFVENAE